MAATATAGSETATDVLGVRVTTQTYPPRHERHGTPHAVVERVFTFTVGNATAVVDQTDYGHAGRFNPCHLRSASPPLQPKTPHLLAAAEAIAALL